MNKYVEALQGPAPSAADIVRLLELADFSAVYRAADEVRAARKGDVVQIRCILEFSNHCVRQCAYCGLNRCNTHARRFRMTEEEILASAAKAAEAGYKTIVLQSGEDRYFTAERLGKLIRKIKRATGMAVTVSCGEMSERDYAHLRACGADRYLLKHETADPQLYASLHPCGTLAARVACLKSLKRLGFETGSGFMVGLPGQTLETLAQDILLLREIGCDMAGIGPFIPHPDTPLGGCPAGGTELTKRLVAITRLVLPDCNLPATTSLGVLADQAKADVFSCGANVVMRKVTPEKYKQLYEIYPSKLGETHVRADRLALERQIRSLDRIPL